MATKTIIYFRFQINCDRNSTASTTSSSNVTNSERKKIETKTDQTKEKDTINNDESN